MPEEIVDQTVDELEPVEAVEETKSIEDTAREAWQKISSKEESPSEEKSDQESAEDRSRDDKGRFAKKETTNEPQEQTTPLETPQEKPAAIPVELQRLGLRKEEAEAIAANPVAMQAVIRRFEESRQGVEQFRQRAHFGDEMQQAIAPYMQTMQQIGVQPAFAVQRLFAADHALRSGSPQQKQQMLMQIARDYQVDMNFDPAQMSPMSDPNIMALQMQIQQMRDQMTQQEKAAKEREEQSFNNEIQRFSSDPAHIHFEEVRAEMAALFQAGLVTSLKDAYERAIYDNPVVRAKVLAKQQEEALARQKAEAAQKAQDAKRAASVNVSRRGTLPPVKPQGTMEDTARAAAERLGII